MLAFHRIPSRSRHGATLVVICILMIVLVAMVAFTVDVGRMYLVRAQMQTAVDSGALAAAMQLKADNKDLDAAMAKASEFVQYNRVGWLVTVPDEAITSVVGTWDSETDTFSEGGEKPNAVRVAANTANEPLFFGTFLGQSDFAVPRDAIAKSGGNRLDVIMTLDLSGSMGSQGRIQALQVAAPDFVNVIEEVGDDDRIGVMGYGAIPNQYDPQNQGHNGTPYTDAPQSLYPENSDWVGVLEAPLTDDFDYLRNNVLDNATLTANKYNGWTPIGAALRDSVHYLETNARDGVDKVVVLMSDGHANKPSGNGPGYAREMAAYAATLDIKVYTISLGAAADEDLMIDIAAATGAEHFDASSQGDHASDITAELKKAFRHVAGAIKQTQLVQ